MAAKQTILTLGDVVDGFLARLEEDGAGPGTLASYGLELRIAARELGADTALSELSVEQLAAYLEGPVVNCTRSGKPKAASSIAKSKRVLRQALAWAHEAAR